jgi:hypothetical protein
VLNPGLHSALDVYRSRGRIHPPDCNQQHDCKQPEKQSSEDEPSNGG